MSGGGEYQRLQDAPEDIEYGFALAEQPETEDAAAARHTGFAHAVADAAMHPPPTAPSSVDTTGSHGKGAAIMQQHYPPRQPKDRKKKFGRKMNWLVVRQDGSSQTVVMDKRQLTQVMGLEIPMRDLRLMDPTLQAWEPYAQILVRDNAMVISIEHARLILSADKVLIPLDFEKTEVGERFIKHLEATIRERAAEEASRRQATAAAAGGGGGSSGGGARAAASGGAAAAGGGGGVPAPAAVSGRESAGGIRDDGGRDADLDLPFELHMLEVALGEVCRHLARQVAALEALAHPALDALTRNADASNLERVRKIKTQHQRLGGRVAGLREVLERYMEDDQDMYRMCLSKRRDSDFEAIGSDNTLLLSRASAGRHLAAVHLLRGHSHSIPKSPPAFLERLGSLPRGRRSSDSDTSSATSGDVHDLLEVENLLESYYSLVDSTHAKINAIGEYIDDTEDLINIELDYSRNRLLRVEILITVATFCLALHNLLAGILGENLVLPSTITQDLWGFALINGTALATCVALFFLAWRMMAKLKMI